MKYIIGNWKSNKNIPEAESWFKTFRGLYSQKQNLNLQNIETVICPPFVLLPLVLKLRDEYKLPLKLGAQDISPFPNGAYTGEVAAGQLAEFADHVIIGHSERRNNFGETDQLLAKKVQRANEAGLKSIFCIQDEHTAIPDGVDIVAYEPVWAIGTGKTDTPDNADKVAQKVKARWGGKTLIYGGSVVPDNIKGFVTTQYIDGVLPGGASLDPQKFWEMVVNAASI